MNTFARSEFLRHINTVLITLVLGISLWVLDQTAKSRRYQREIEIGFAVANQVLVDHLTESEMWKDMIKDLADQKHPATQNRYTQSDAMRDKDALRREMYNYMEKYYQKKKEQ